MASHSGSVQFSIGAVIGSSVGVYARNFVSFTVLSLLIGLISLAINIVFPATADGTITTAEVGWTGFFATIIAVLLVNGLTQAALIYGTFQDLRGQKAGLGDCIARGIATAVPVIVGSMLMTLGIGVGMLLLVVPGVILALMWWVYIPAIVVERKSIMEGFGRSAELTSGRRWHILGLLIVAGLLFSLASIVVTLIGTIVAAAGGIAATFINYVVMSVVTAFSAILAAVGYYYLRAEKEGINVDDIARVFD